MGNETLYSYALTNLNSITSGASDFEKICHIIAKSMYPKYKFNVPEGGRGTQDGGYDGYDPIKKAKLACSIEKNYTRKINQEIEKSKKNKDTQLFYFSNQTISEPLRKEIENKHADSGINLIIHGIDILSREIDKYLRDNYDSELYDLLRMSSLCEGERYHRGDAIPCEIEIKGNIYKKRICCRDKNSNNAITVSENPLLDFILDCCSKSREKAFRHIVLLGIAYIGKSLLMKTTYNALIDKFSDERNYDKYQFIPFVNFRELKYYKYGTIRTIIKNKIDPIYIFLDGLDELNPQEQKDLNREIQNILYDYNCVRFVIAGRHSSFMEIELLDKSVQLYMEKNRYIDDIDLKNLMINYKGTHIADFLPIPMYRNFVLENQITKNTTLDEFYDKLVRNNLEKDIERYYNSNYDIDTIIGEISRFCYNLFVNQKITFTENDIKKYFKDKELLLFFRNSSLIDYHDKENISFVSTFYYEYFVATQLSTMDKKTIIQAFFVRRNVNVPHIDILTLFMSYTKTKSKRLYKMAMDKLLKNNIDSILISEFDSIPDDERFEYYESIQKKYKDEKRLIYYFRFSQKYGPLKNIDNMAQRMQQLLPDRYKTEAVAFLKAEINNFIQQPSKENIWAFANAVILLNPYIDDLWYEKEQTILRELSLPLIRFFLYNDLSKEIDGLLSERIILDWYSKYKWTTELESLYKDISGDNRNILSEIIDDQEYRLKFNILACFQKGNTVNPLFFPVIHYAMKNKYIRGNEMAIHMPITIDDDFEMSSIKMDPLNYELSYLTEKLELNISDILDLLMFAVNNKIYDLIKSVYDNPIKILEEKLYKNIVFIEHNDYERFSQFYFSIDSNIFGNKLFQVNQTKEIENLKNFLLDFIIDKKISHHIGILYFIRSLIDSMDIDSSLDRLRKVKELLPDIYKSVVHGIFNTDNHILKDNPRLKSESNVLFPHEIEKTKYIETVKKEIESVKNNDFVLIQYTDMMTDELKKINDFMSKGGNIDNNKISLYHLYHDNIVRTISYIDEHYELPIFSECAIGIMEDFYKCNICDIEIIIKQLSSKYFREENFYLYLYWAFLNISDNKESIDIKNKIKADTSLTRRIIDSMNKDVSKKFDKPIEDFNNGDKEWLTPFFYYYEILLDNKAPNWMQQEHILKLIAMLDLYSNDDMFSASWLCRKFPQITHRQIIEYGLRTIDNKKIDSSTIRHLFIDYYNASVNDALTNKILSHFIFITKKLFESLSFDDSSTECQSISLFWRQCSTNHIDSLFPKFTIETITSPIPKDCNNSIFYCRKSVLLYCIKVATDEQKNRIIREIKTDIAKKKLFMNDDSIEEIHKFLAALGSEDSIKYIIELYLNGKGVYNNFTDEYTLGFMKQSNRLLNEFINLFIYCSEKHNERRRLLQNIAKDGIKKHITKKNFKHFEKIILKTIHYFQKEQLYGLSDYYREYLLQMEQFVFSDTISENV